MPHKLLGFPPEWEPQNFRASDDDIIEGKVVVLEEEKHEYDFHCERIQSHKDNILSLYGKLDDERYALLVIDDDPKVVFFSGPHDFSGKEIEN